MTPLDAKIMEHRYKPMKQMLKDEAGIVKKEDMIELFNPLRKQANVISWVGWMSVLISIPLMLILVGFFILPAALLMVFQARKLKKIYNKLIEMIQNDPELCEA